MTADRTDIRDADIQLSREVDEWIVAVLRRAGVKVHVFSRDHGIGLFVPNKWARVIDALSAGIHAAARGKKLPTITPGETGTQSAERKAKKK